MTTVYGVPLSPFARKVIMTLEIKGIDFELNPVTPLDKPAGFELMSPLGKIPAFEDDILKISDSTIICEYLDERYPEHRVYPQDLVLRARARWFEEYADTAVASACGPVFFERVVKPAFIQVEPDEELVHKALSGEMPKVLDYLEGQVSGGRFMVGDELTVADLALGGNFLNARYGGFQVDEVRWPNFSEYLQRLLATPAFVKRMAADREMMGG